VRGFEPPTSDFSGRRSPAELHPQRVGRSAIASPSMRDYFRGANCYCEVAKLVQN
jgi:hypothetical protein